MFLYSKWLDLSISTRHKLAKELGIAKTSSTHVQDNRVVNDGYAIKDVEAALERCGEDFDNLVLKAEGFTTENDFKIEKNMEVKADDWKEVVGSNGTTEKPVAEEIKDVETVAEKEIETPEIKETEPKKRGRKAVSKD